VVFAGNRQTGLQQRKIRVDGLPGDAQAEAAQKGCLQGGIDPLGPAGFQFPFAAYLLQHPGTGDQRGIVGAGVLASREARRRCPGVRRQIP